MFAFRQRRSFTNSALTFDLFSVQMVQRALVVYKAAHLYLRVFKERE